MHLFFFLSRRRHTRCLSDWSSDVCSSDLSCRQHRLFFFWDAYLLQGKITGVAGTNAQLAVNRSRGERSEERRVGKECRSRWWTNEEKKIRKEMIQVWLT